MKNTPNNNSAFREIFSGSNGKLSAKRVVGAISMFVALISTMYLVVTDGSNSVVEDLLTTIIILSSSLLGLPAITGIFGNKMHIHTMQQQNLDEETQPIHVEQSYTKPSWDSPSNERNVENTEDYLNRNP